MLYPPILQHSLLTALTVKSPFLLETKMFLPVVPTSSTSWGDWSMEKQLGLVERMWNLELEGFGALTLDDCEQCFFHWEENRLPVLPHGATENRSNTPSAGQIRGNGAYVSSLYFTKTDFLCSIDCCLMFLFFPCSPSLDVLLFYQHCF